MVRAYTLASTTCLPGEIYNIGSGVGHTVRQVIEILESLTKIKVELKVNDALVRSADVPVLIADSTKFRDVSGYFPTISLDKTVSDLLDSIRNKKG